METKILKTKYKVTVEKIEEVEYAETESYYADADTGKEVEYDHRPRITQYRATGKRLKREDNTKILIQEVDDLDLTHVIKAVNKI